MPCSRTTTAALLLAAVSLFPVSTFGQDHEQASSQLTSNDFSYSTSPHEVEDLFSLDDSHGWMAVTDHNTDAGYVLRTQDGGKTWSKSAAPAGMRRIFFINPNQGWALRFIADVKTTRTTIYLLATRDGGRSWEPTSDKPVVQSTKENFRIVTSMAFMDESRGWLVGAGSAHTGFVLETTDGGRTFRKPEGLPAVIPNCIAVYARADIGVVILGIGAVLRSPDGGKTWESPIDLESLGISRQLFDMSSATFLKDGRGWLVGQTYGGTVLGTSDFGRSWRKEFLDKGHTNFQSIWAIDGKRRCAVGYSTQLFCTSDDGATWTSRNSLPQRSNGQSDFFRNLALVQSGRGWVLRDGGYLYRTNDGGETWHEFDPLALGESETQHTASH